MLLQLPLILLMAPCLQVVIILVLSISSLFSIIILKRVSFHSNSRPIYAVNRAHVKCIRDICYNPMGLGMVTIA